MRVLAGRGRFVPAVLAAVVPPIAVVVVPVVPGVLGRRLKVMDNVALLLSRFQLDSMNVFSLTDLMPRHSVAHEPFAAFCATDVASNSVHSLL